MSESYAVHARRMVQESAALVAKLRRELAAEQDPDERMRLRAEFEAARGLYRGYADLEVVRSGRELADLTTPPEAWAPEGGGSFGAHVEQKAPSFHRNWRCG